MSWPANDALAAWVESVKTTTAEPELVTVPPAPGSGLVLVSAATACALSLRSTTADEPLSVRLARPAPAAPALAVTSKVFAAPELRPSVPPLTTAVPVK